MADFGVEIEGLDDWRKALARADMASHVKEANHAVGSFVADKADIRRAGLQGQFPAYKQVKIKASRAQRGVQVSVGPKSVGFAAEFGAFTHPVFGRFQSQTGFARKVWPLWGGSGDDAGFLVFPTAREHHDKISSMYLEAIDKATKVAFPEV